MNLKFNVGPLQLLDNFVKEILASDSSQSYLRKEQAKTRRLVDNDLNKSAAMETIEKSIEKSLIFRHHFGKTHLSKVYNFLLCEKSTELFCKYIDKNVFSLRMSFAIFMMVTAQF
jgi:hypothetical protein